MVGFDASKSQVFIATVGYLAACIVVIGCLSLVFFPSSFLQDKDSVHIRGKVQNLTTHIDNTAQMKRQFNEK